MHKRAFTSDYELIGLPFDENGDCVLEEFEIVYSEQMPFFVIKKNLREKQMSKELSEMTKEELWELFPITLSEHRKTWKDDYANIESELQKLLAKCSVSRISHIGSTSIAGIRAKNIIDVLLEIPTDEDMEHIAKIIESGGFTRMSEEPKRISFNRGYTKDGFAEKVYHLHLRYSGDNDELFFRDYLNEYPEIAAEYEKLKLSLQKKYEHDRDAYTNAKTSFIRRFTNEARKKYAGRYSC